MPKVNKILVAVDFSQYSRDTLAMALKLAGETGAGLVAVNVLNQRDVEAVKNAVHFGQTGGLDEAAFIERQTRERRELLDKLLAECGAGDRPVERVIRVGVPAQEILDAIRDLGVDLVVIGAKGRTNLSMALFGSTADRVYRHSPVSVLSMRGLDQADEPGTPAS